MATFGAGLYTPTCQCCRPDSVIQRNVTVECDDGKKYETQYSQITSCACKKQACEARPAVNDVTITDANDGAEMLEKRSLLHQLEELDRMDKATLQRRRRELLNDLAMIHAQKKKK